jgi:hypothetical protein
MDKRAQLLGLATRRQTARWAGYGCLGDYHQGAYECDEVSPYSKTARNLDARVFVMLQDWASGDQLLKPFDHDAAELGYTPGQTRRVSASSIRRRSTNVNLVTLLQDTFNFDLRMSTARIYFPSSNSVW